MTRADTIVTNLRPLPPVPWASDREPLENVIFRLVEAVQRLESLGGAAVAGEAAGPWVVRIDVGGAKRWHAPTGPASADLAAAQRWPTWVAASHAAISWGTSYHATVLTLAEAQRMEAAATLASLPGHTQKVLAELANEEPSAEVLAADDGPDEADPSVVPVEVRERGWQWRPVGDDTAFAPPFGCIRVCIDCGALVAGGPTRCVRCAEALPDPTPSPPKPAGWVVRWISHDLERYSEGPQREFGVGGLTGAHVYTDKAEAEADAATVRRAADGLLERLVDAVHGGVGGARGDLRGDARGEWPVCVLPVDAAGNVLEERAAPAPDVVAQCRAAESEPAPREPDGWVVVDSDGRCQEAWGRYETHYAEGRAKSLAAQYGGTARPFWLDAPPVHPSSLTDVVTTLEEERNMLRANIAALREASDVAVTVRDAEAATLRAEVERLTRERDEARAERTAHAYQVCMRLADAIGMECDVGTPDEGGGTMPPTDEAIVERVHVLRAERDALAAEVQRGREQKPVRWLVRMPAGHEAIVPTLPDPALSPVTDEERRRGWTAAPLYLAPVVRDHSGVIAQCALALGSLESGVFAGYHMQAAANALRAALAALRGAS